MPPAKLAEIETVEPSVLRGIGGSAFTAFTRAYKRLYDLTKLLDIHIETPLVLAERLMRLELYILEELGFGLDLSADCVNIMMRKNKRT